MSPEVSAAAAPRAAWWDSPPIRFLRALWRETIANRVSDGRLRSNGWPTGLRALVWLALGVYLVAAVLVVFSSALRRSEQLIVLNYKSVGTPSGVVWLLIFLVSFSLALVATAALHAPWWGKIIALLLLAASLGAWGLTTTAGSSIATSLAVFAFIAGLLVWYLVRIRRRFSWWEFPISLVLVSGPVLPGLWNMRAGRASGFEFAPQALLQGVGTLSYLVLPAAISAGVAVAEITVRAATVTINLLDPASGRRALAHPLLPYLILAAVVLLRVAQCVWQLVHLDPVRHGWVAFGPAAVKVILFAAVAAVLLRISRRHSTPPSVSELPEDMGRISLPVSVALIAYVLPVTLLLLGLQIILGLLPDSVVRRWSLDAIPTLSNLADPIRLATGLVLLVVAAVLARRGRARLALLLGCTGVMLIMLAQRFLTGGRLALVQDADALNLIATAVALGLAGWYLVRRRLSRERAVGLTCMLVLSALFSYRDFVSDPVGALIGYSGAALVLFGLTWDFLTSSDWANRGGKQFSQPTRVLLVLANTLMTVSVLAYGALVRNPDAALDLERFAELGNIVFGTALLAAAFLAAGHAVADDRPAN
jgi:hypothetical protein